MTLQQLEYLVAVERTRHFGRAADECGVTQPTLSAMLQKLEQELGFRLFERSAAGVKPTASGEKILEQARRTLREARRLKEMAAEETGGIGGTFRLGILPTIAPYLLPRFFPALCRQHPEIDLRVKEMKTADMKVALTRGELDAAIWVRTDAVEELPMRTLYFEQFFAYVAEGDRLYSHSSIRTTDLADEVLWLLDEGHCFRDQLVKFCHLKGAADSQRIYSLGSIETFMRMVEQGAGVTFLPELALSQLTSEQKQLVRPLAMPVPVREVVLSVAPDFVRRRMASLLETAVKESVPQEMLRFRNTHVRI